MSDIRFALKVSYANHDDFHPKTIHENLKCVACGSTYFKSAHVSDKQLYFVCSICNKSNAAATILGANTQISITHV